MFELITFAAEPGVDQLNIQISSNQGNYSGKPSRRVIKMKLHGAPKYTQTVVRGSSGQNEMNIVGNNECLIVFDGKPMYAMFR